MATENHSTATTSRASDAFGVLLTKIQQTHDRLGPAAAARLCDDKADAFEELLDQAADPDTLMTESLGMLGLDLNEVDTWARALRRQSRHLRRQIA